MNQYNKNNQLRKVDKFRLNQNYKLIKIVKKIVSLNLQVLIKKKAKVIRSYKLNNANKFKNKMNNYL